METPGNILLTLLRSVPSFCELSGEDRASTIRAAYRAEFEMHQKFGLKDGRSAKTRRGELHSDVQKCVKDWKERAAGIFAGTWRDSGLPRLGKEEWRKFVEQWSGEVFEI